jgi:hypothetical protein
MNEPKLSDVRGVITKITEASSTNTGKLTADSKVISISRFDADMSMLIAAGKHPQRVIDVWFAINQINEFQLNHILWEGNAVTVPFEERIAGQTEYEAEGVPVKHTASNNGGRNAYNVSMIELAMLAVPTPIIELIERKREEHAEDDHERPSSIEGPLQEHRGARTLVELWRRLATMKEGSLKRATEASVNQLISNLSAEELDYAKDMLANLADGKARGVKAPTTVTPTTAGTPNPPEGDRDLDNPS